MREPSGLRLEQRELDARVRVVEAGAWVDVTAPAPTSLSTSTLPPIRSASLRQMARPRPVPP